MKIELSTLTLFVFSLLSLLATYVSFHLVARVNFLLRYPSPFQFFFLFFFCYNIAAWPFVLLGLSNRGSIAFDPEFYPIFFFYLHGCLIAIAAGAFVAARLLGFQKWMVADYFRRPVVQRLPDRLDTFLTIAIVSLLTAYAIKNIPIIPELVSEDYYSARMEVAITGTYLDYVLSKVFIPLAATFAFGCALLMGGRFKYPLMFGVAILALLGSASTFQKSPFVLFIITIGLTFLLLRRRALGLLHYVVICGFALSLAGIISYYSGAEGWYEVVDAFINRLSLLGNFLNYEALLLAHQDPHFYLGGTSFPLLFEDSSYHNELGVNLWYELFWTKSNYDQVGSANTSFIVALYWDFGFLGGLLGSLIFGAALQFAQILMIRSPKDLINSALYCSLCVFALKFNYTHLGTALLSEGWGLIYLAFLAWEGLNRLVTPQFNRTPDASISQSPAYQATSQLQRSVNFRA